MNKRIKEIVDQVNIPHQVGDLCHTVSYQELEKFAQLIVQECSLVIRNGGYRKGAFGNEDLRPSEIATMIEEHFGVEE